MFYEDLTSLLSFDVEKLREDVKKHVFTLGNQIIQGEEYETPMYHGFGGWSITSRTGDWKDGWDFFQNDEGQAMEVYFPKGKSNYEALKFFDIAHSMEHKNPTQAYQGEIARVIDQITELGLTPRRVRVTCLKARAKSLVHRDADTDDYMARLHIPLITNDKCVFICNGTTLHMEAGKVYAVWVNQWHQIRNDSDEDRYHIIMDFYDTKKVTKTFNYNGDISQLEEMAARMRQNIDEAVIPTELYEKFEAVRQSFITKGEIPLLK
jgi:hypothetical protein